MIMKIGVIGPNSLGNTSEAKLKERRNLLSKVAKIISDFKVDIVLTPDKKSLLDFFGEKCKEFNVKKIWIIAPMKDGAEKYLNLEVGEIIDCEMWHNQPSKFCEETDIMICLGYSAGVLSEIGASKYFNPKKILIINEFISSELPIEINKSMDIKYLALNELEDYFKTNFK